MIIVDDLKSDLRKSPPQRLVMAVGNFDGLHLGHQAVIGRAVDVARQQEFVAAALTFRQHPRSVLFPDDRPLLLLPSGEKVRRIEQLGIEVLFHLNFTLDLASLSAEEFIGHVLCEALNVSQIVVGENFRFGNKRRGTPSMLQKQGAKLGFQVTVIPPVRIADQIVSSTVIRRLLHQGQVKEASIFLNRDYEISGKVVRGEGRGRGLGFPTANLEVQNELIPLGGVYAVWVVYKNKRYPGMANIGHRPTFPGALPSFEVHAIDFNDDIYDQTLQLHFVERVRSEHAFPRPEDLREQLLVDRQQILSILRDTDRRSIQSPSH